MFKTEINKNDIEAALYNALREKVLLIEFNPEDNLHKKGIRIVTKDKETGRYTNVLSEILSTTGDNIYKQLVLNLITFGFDKIKK